MVQRRVRRHKSEVDEDIRRYNELLKKNLEKDIPPRRSCKVFVKYEEQADEVVPDIVPLRYTRSATRKLKEKTATASMVVKPPANKISRPKYSRATVNPVPSQARVIKRDGCTEVPIPLDKVTEFNNFQDKVTFDNSYSDMIKLINSNTDRDPSKSAIDIALHHRLLHKNLELERQKFALTEEYYNDSYNKNSLSTVSFFNSSDIDSFFDALNGFESSRELLRDKLKREIPLV
ncbi:uncharacterized protein RJT20DRAFT_147777 [Scheffersomyces xylosifermentans]|uniref:uncharacterized protein n=1 Tax=Scheffersomyces xylosifermentans TaxID=1304137 RepID=UPI00315C9A9F